MLDFLNWPRITAKQVSQRVRAEKALDRIERVEEESRDAAERHSQIQQSNHFIQSIFGDPS